jgi:ubiquinone/menaquinone biosynthesis C-methylase UbiE
MNTPLSEDTEYDDDFIARLEFRWGKGFLSPGGATEVLAIAQGIQIEGRKVLDFGCGLGGADLVLAEKCHPSSVIGLDIDAGLITKARALAKEAGLDGKVQFVKSDPGKLDFENDSFDVVFSKDAILHIDDKRWIYEEFSRLLKSGGALAISDWLKAEGDCLALESFFLEDLGLTVVFQTVQEVRELLGSIGFSDIDTDDRHSWFKELTKREADQLSGPRKEEYIKAVGEENAMASINAVQKLASIAESGELRPTHVRARWRH